MIELDKYYWQNIYFEKEKKILSFKACGSQMYTLLGLNYPIVKSLLMYKFLCVGTHQNFST